MYWQRQDNSISIQLEVNGYSDVVLHSIRNLFRDFVTKCKRFDVGLDIH